LSRGKSKFHKKSGKRFPENKKFSGKEGAGGADSGSPSLSKPSSGKQQRSFAPSQGRRFYSDRQENRTPLVPPDSILERALGASELQRIAALSRKLISEMIAGANKVAPLVASGPVPVPTAAMSVAVSVASSAAASAVASAAASAGSSVSSGSVLSRLKAKVAHKADALAGETPTSAPLASPVVEVAFEPVSEPVVVAPPHLDPWQEEALAVLNAGKNLVVDAPTSAGKTRVIEALIDERIGKGLRLVYTSPVKSLSNDKYREFSEKYGRENVGINTGDFKENLGAPIVLATLETYRNSLLGVEPRMDRFVVVYDEYHYLQDEGRGSAWEESIVLTPKESQVVLLSASVPNADEFARWISSLKDKPCEVVRVAERPVPLVDAVYTKYGWLLADKLNLKPQTLSELRVLAKQMRQEEKRGFRRGQQRERYAHLVRPVGDALKDNMGPVVVYAGRRADTESVAHTLAKYLPGGFTGEPAERLHKRIETLQGWDYVPSELQRLIKKTGIAYHHSGLIPPGRVAIETLLKEGFLRVCSGTMGISLGVNFAVRSALVADESRPGESGETRYTNTEVMQMLGRAGRRGKDKQGFSLWPNIARFAVQKPYGREPCLSSLKFDPTTVIGILGQKESFAYLSEFYLKSFFMRGKDPNMVLLLDHDLLSSVLYRQGFGEQALGCSHIPDTYSSHVKAKRHHRSPCDKCPAKAVCHPICNAGTRSFLNRVVEHLRSLGALDGPVPTTFGQLARFFPQAGGLIIAKWLARGQMNAGNFREYVQAMACFCAAHHKDIPSAYANMEFLEDLGLANLVETFYPQEIFAELYDEKFHSEEKIFREFNIGAASVLEMWLDEGVSWEKLVEEHATQKFSAGDCMMVLFRCATLLQSCVRIADTHPEIAEEAARLRNIILREPLDARNRMLLEEDESETKEPEEALEAEESDDSENVEESDDEESDV
jgi:superfamily II RNA helicase